jgi:glucokinase
VASIAHYATGGEPEATAVFAEFGKTLGIAIKALLADFAPDVVVLGGGISRSAHLFLDAVKAELNDTPIEVRIAKLGDNAPLAGAGVAWFGHSGEGVRA